MKCNITHFLSYLFLISLLIACKSGNKQDSDIPFTNPTEEEIQLYRSIIDIHDQVMPKMGEITNLQSKLKAEKHLIPIGETSDMRVQINEHLSQLNKGENGMFDWMNEFAKLQDLERDEVLNFLIIQEDQVRTMADQIESSIAGAQEFLKTFPYAQ